MRSCGELRAWREGSGLGAQRRLLAVEARAGGFGEAGELEEEGGGFAGAFAGANADDAGAEGVGGCRIGDVGWRM